MLKSILPIGLGLALVAGSTCVHGVLTNRWGAPPDLAAAAAKLDRIPHVIGNWESKAVEIPSTELEAAEAVGHFARLYQSSQGQIQVLIVCGAHGPIAVHPPTICFTGAGYAQTEPETNQAITVGKVNFEFWKTIFTKKSAEGILIPLRTYWAWSVDGRCEAPVNPRMHFASNQHLYKIYVTQVLSSPSTRPTDAETAVFESFLSEFLPKFRAALSEPPAS